MRDLCVSSEVGLEKDAAIEHVSWAQKSERQTASLVISRLEVTEQGFKLSVLCIKLDLCPKPLKPLLETGWWLRAGAWPHKFQLKPECQSHLIAL